MLVENQARGPHADYCLRVYHFDRFPYPVIHEPTEAGPHFYAIAHQHREPGYWAERLQVGKAGGDVQPVVAPDSLQRACAR